MNVTLKALAIVMLMAVLSRSASAQTGLGHIGPTTGEVVGAAVGLAAVTTLVLYLTLHKTYITGCTQSAEGGSSVTDHDGLTYLLVDENSGLKAGERVKLQGKKRKDKQGQTHVPSFEGQEGLRPVSAVNNSARTVRQFQMRESKNHDPWNALLTCAAFGGWSARRRHQQCNDERALSGPLI